MAIQWQERPEGLAVMNRDNLRNCSMMLYFSIRWLDGRAMATMSSVTLRVEGGRERHTDVGWRCLQTQCLTRMRRGLWWPAGLPSNTRVLHSDSLCLRRPAGRGSWAGWPSPGSPWPGCRRAGVPVCVSSTLASSCTNDMQSSSFILPTLAEFDN